MKNKILLIVSLSFALCISCHSKVEKNIDSESEISMEEASGKVDAPITILEIWKKLPLRKLPIDETTNFNNVANDRFLTEEEIVVLKLDKIFTDYSQYKDAYSIRAAYKLELSKRFYSIVINAFKGENELETVLINYNDYEDIIDYKTITYDEIAESISQKKATIEKNFVTIIDKTELEETVIEISKFHINASGEFNIVKDVFTSTIRPNEAIVLNKIYVDTIQFQSYNEDGDYQLLYGRKDYQEVVLIHNFDWEQEKKYIFLENETLQIKWKMDSIWIAGDGETLDFKETIIKVNKLSKE
ncbi:hypothetical protein [Flavobacterium sp.]|uniref:hypothetical protein n=2 Tax=Flavobacterium sp. TaxID=239 RepID=UPI004047DB57